MNTEPQQKSETTAPEPEYGAAKPEASGFIDEKQLLALLPVSRRTLFNWRASGKIPFVRLGGRRVLFHWPSVERTLLRNQIWGGQ
jgi:excisionase family DNA binding protein